MSWIARSSSFLYASSSWKESCRRSRVLFSSVSRIVPNEHADDEERRDLEPVVRVHADAARELDLGVQHERNRRSERRDHAAPAAEDEGRVDDRDEVEPAVEELQRRRLDACAG